MLAKEATRTLPDTKSERSGTTQAVGLWAGGLLFLVMLFIPAPAGMSESSWTVLAMAVLMAVWWVTEALPLAVTSLIPLIILPLFGVASFADTAPNFASSFAFLLLGGLIIGKAFERWNLHYRFALNIILLGSGTPRSIIITLMIAAALLSMWISNTATAIMLAPIAMSLGQAVGANEASRRSLTIAFLLSMAYGTSIGGIATPIGTPTNLVAIGALEEMANIPIGFVDWVIMALPFSLLMLVAAMFVVARDFNRMDDHSTGITGIEKVKAMRDDLGSMASAEKRTLIIFLLVALAWLMRRPINEISIGGAQPFAELSDPAIALIGALLLFIIPSGSIDKKTAPLLDWQNAVKIPWGIILLFGGSISLGSAMSDSGLTQWIGAQLDPFSRYQLIILMAMIVIPVIFITEIVGNVAITAAFAPIVISFALGLNKDPQLFAVPLALAASCAFMLPMATGPNAIIHATGTMRIKDMATAGIRLNLVAIILLLLFFRFSFLSSNKN